MTIATFLALALGSATPAGATVSGTSAAGAASIALPTRMAALGDSISQANDSCGSYGDCPQNNWSTGTASAVDSHASRIRAAGVTSLVTKNDSLTGSTSADLLRQANVAISQKVQYITIESGANDACTPTVSQMTPVTTYRAQVKAALSAINAASPTTRVFVASVPNLKTLWAVSKSKFAARLVWSSANVCQSMLAQPTDTSAAASTRRSTVLQRVVDYNTALAQVCALYANCTFDNNAVFNYVFTASQISTLDYFHPSVSGQATLSALTWAKGPYAALG